MALPEKPITMSDSKRHIKNCIETKCFVTQKTAVKGKNGRKRMGSQVISRVTEESQNLNCLAARRLPAEAPASQRRSE